MNIISRKIFLFTLAALLFFAASGILSQASAQQSAFIISGSVKHMATQAAIQDVFVTVKDTSGNIFKGSSSTDVSGNYSITLQSPGFYTLVASKTGFSDASPPDLAELSDSKMNIVVNLFMDPLKTTLPLSAGWNFVSFPQLPSLPAPVATVLNDVSSSVRIVWGYDNVNKIWLKYAGQGSGTTGQNTLTSFEFGKGYWIYMNYQGEMNLSLWSPPSASSIHLSTGWNLVGYNGADGSTVDTVLSGIAGKWSILWNWENSQWHMKRPSSMPVAPSILNLFPDITAFAQGKAYWIRTNEQMDWITGNDRQSLAVTMLSMNDTHSFAEPFSASLTVDGASTAVTLGGYTRLKSAIDDVKSRENNTLLLHAGDAVTGTLYFTRFQGDSDLDFLNYFGIEAMTFGNHEFDKGPSLVDKIIKTATFPIISSNVDFSNEPIVTNKPPSYLIKRYGNESVGIIGATTTISSSTSSPGPNIVFSDVTGSVASAVSQLTSSGVNKIILLSHIGFDEDKKLAQAVSGIDVIIGGHSHSLLGDASAISSLNLYTGLADDALRGAYPTVVKSPEGKDVLVTQAWRNGGIFGTLKVGFNKFGDITSYTGRPVLVVGDAFRQNKVDVPAGSDTYNRIVQVINSSPVAHVYAENTGAKAKLAPYTQQVIDFKSQKVADASEDIMRKNPPSTEFNSGPGAIIADSMLWKTKGMSGEIAIISRGAVKCDFRQGTVAYGDVYTCLPYGGTYYVINLKGSDVKNALEDGVGFQIQSYPDGPWLPFVGGMQYTVNKAAPKGSRISVKVKNNDGSYSDIDQDKTYRVVTNAFMANGGDGYDTLKNTSTASKYDTGFVDAEVLAEYLTFLKTISNPAEQRINVTTTTGSILYMNLFAGTGPYSVVPWFEEEFRTAA